ncbi:MAG: DUF5718 family protein [Solirubrobacteraceae bacterium]
MITVDPQDLRDVFGFGVAGNFAGHLEQAGEAADFVSVASVGEAPKGIFPWYVPGREDFLGVFPLSSEAIATPPSDEPLNLQIEPEVGLLADVTYDASGTPTAVVPHAIGAFNDCSIRRPGARKISHKKNWGPASKGVASTFIPVTDLSPDGPTETLRLASFLRRAGRTDAYGVDSPLPGYSYYGDTLLAWIVDRLNHQEGSDDTPLEPVGSYLDACGRPTRVLVGIGATRYTPVGESTFLVPGDEAIVVVYDGARHDADAVLAAVAAGRERDLDGASVLVQQVAPPA